jgi:uncharacterized peroxidase-related enzyme
MSQVKEYMSKIRVIEPQEATGRLKEIYDLIISKRGKLAEMHKIQSLRPESILHHMDLYMEIMYSKSELTRANREMMAVVVSSANACEYCQTHHAEALLHYWKDAERVRLLRENYHETPLNKLERVLCEFAHHLTQYPESFASQRGVEPLKEAGFSDEAILDAALVVGYFNFVNRLVLSLGVPLETDHGKGYNY